MHAFPQLVRFVMHTVYTLSEQTGQLPYNLSLGAAALEWHTTSDGLPPAAGHILTVMEDQGNPFNLTFLYFQELCHHAYALYFGKVVS